MLHSRIACSAWSLVEGEILGGDNRQTSTSGNYILHYTNTLKGTHNNLKSDKLRKASETYKQKRRSAHYSVRDSYAQNHYGVTAQQPHIACDELKVLCARDVMGSHGKL